MNILEAIKKYKYISLNNSSDNNWYIEKDAEEGWRMCYKKNDGLLEVVGFPNCASLEMSEILSDNWEEYQKYPLKQKVIAMLQNFDGYLPTRANYRQSQAEEDLKNLIAEIENLDWGNKND